MKNLRLYGTLLIVFMLFALPAAAAGLKIGHADLQKALNDCEAGKNAKATLQEEAKRLEGELNAKQEDLKKMKQEIDKKGSIWNKETREAKEMDFKVKSQQFQKQFMEYGEKLNKKKQDLESNIIKSLRDIVADIAKQQGYTYVFERSVGGILYAPDGDDLTPAVIKDYDKRYREKK